MKDTNNYHEHQDDKGMWHRCYHQCRHWMSPQFLAGWFVASTITFPFEHIQWDHIWPFRYVGAWLDRSGDFQMWISYVWVVAFLLCIVFGLVYAARKDQMSNERLAMPPVTSFTNTPPSYDPCKLVWFPCADEEYARQYEWDQLKERQEFLAKGNYFTADLIRDDMKSRHWVIEDVKEIFDAEGIYAEALFERLIVNDHENGKCTVATRRMIRFFDPSYTSYMKDGDYRGTLDELKKRREEKYGSEDDEI